MQNNRVWERACGLTGTVVEGVRSTTRRSDCGVGSTRCEGEESLWTVRPALAGL